MEEEQVETNKKPNGEKINWDEMLAGKFIRLQKGIRKVLVLMNWRAQQKFKDDKGNIKPGVEFDVIQEDAQDLIGDDMKSYTITAIKALAQVRPLCEKAESLGKQAIKIALVRVGEGRHTEYDIKEVV